jgi:glycine/D-amino acid oxidase-like deaminating enzyme
MKQRRLGIQLGRRRLLAGAGAALLVAAVDGCSVQDPRARPSAATEPQLRLAPLRAATDRITQITVCTRPFRAQGPRIEAEQVGQKTVVHNYGHGGSGWSLSWGSSAIAVQKAMSLGERDVAVIGCGAMGLTSALLLQRAGARVTIYAKDLPPNTTSNIAGAQWFPVYVFRRGQTAPDFMPRFVEACHLANRRYQLMVGARYGIRWLPNYEMGADPIPEGGLHSFDSPIRDLVPEMRDLDAAENPFPFPYVRQFETMMIEPNTYLPALLQDFQVSGGKIEVREVHNPAELQNLSERVIVNCTGLGAKALFGDEELTPIKGQLTFLLPQPEIQYCTLAEDLYMFPRSDGIALGGTHEVGVWSLEPDLQAKQRIVAGQQKLFSEMR